MKRLVVLAALLLALTGCTGRSDPEPTPSPTSEPAVFAVACPTFGGPAGAGDALPAMSLPCLGTSGGSVQMDGAPGVPTVVNFWATWCPPCRAELGYLDELDQKAGGTVEVLGVVSLDSATNADDFADQKGLTFPSVVDAKGDLLKEKGLQPGLPITLFLDATGAIVGTHIGEFTNYADLRAVLKQELGVDVP